MDEKLTEWLIEEVKNRGFSGIFFFAALAALAFVGLGMALGWALGIRKSLREAEGLGLDNQKKRGELLTTLEQNQAKFVSARETLNIAMVSLRDAITASKPPKELQSYRDELCRHYDTDYLSALDDYLKFIPVLADKRESCARAVSEIVPGFQTMCSFLAMVNHPKLMERLPDAASFRLRKATLDSLFARTKELIPVWHFKARWRVWKIRKQTKKFIRKET